MPSQLPSHPPAIPSQGNLLRLSVEVSRWSKNLVLLAATASLALHTLGTRPPAATAHPLPADGDPDSGTPTKDAA
jgi:hypothetical protein